MKRSPLDHVRQFISFPFFLIGLIFTIIGEVISGESSDLRL